MRIVDLRSDTVTQPTLEMRRAMAGAVVGDDLYGEDPTVKYLESTGARLMGKERALFVPSGTFGNLLAIQTHCKAGDELIVEDSSHIVAHELGGAGAYAGVQLRTIDVAKEQMTPDALRSRIRRDGLHSPRTGLICVENAHSLLGAIPLDLMKQLYAVAKEERVPLHLDGARIFNAALALHCDVADLAQNADSVMFCLSKGLCAPVGSLLAGTEEFISRARLNRQRMGGGLRQAGVIAAPGLLALLIMPRRLSEDHEHAKILETSLEDVPGISLRTLENPVNMVYFSHKKRGNPQAFIQALAGSGVIINPPENGLYRLVTHYGITKEDVLTAARAIAQYQLNGGNDNE
jgi:threonine aldolase